MKLRLNLAALIGLSYLAASCAIRPPAYYSGNRSSVIHDDADYRLAVVELGEFGSYKDPNLNQIRTAVDLVKSTDRPLLVMYIHGWHNSATSGDVEHFNGFLNRLARARQIITNHLNIVGIYIAWPGESLQIPVVNTFTFWGRKRTAERIANNGDCLDAIEQLAHAARLHSQSYVFLIGHSFGGLIVERTVEHTVRTLQGEKNVRPPWDLALMLNPASDSVLARQLVVDLAQLYRYDAHSGFVPRSGGRPIPENQPTVVELQSENDQATGLTFPVGSTLGSAIGGHWAWDAVPLPESEPGGVITRTVSEKEFSLRTPGNNPYLVNYIVTPCNAPRPNTGGDAFDYNLLHNPSNRIFYTSAPQNAAATVSAAEKSDQRPKTSAPEWRAWQIQYAGDVDRARYGSNVRVPLWIVRVPAFIIDNHGGIWSDNNMALMAAIFRLHRPLSGTAEAPVNKAVIESAKPYVLPTNPQLKR